MSGAGREGPDIWLGGTGRPLLRLPPVGHSPSPEPPLQGNLSGTMLDTLLHWWVSRNQEQEKSLGACGGWILQTSNNRTQHILINFLDEPSTLGLTVVFLDLQVDAPDGGAEGPPGGRLAAHVFHLPHHRHLCSLRLHRQGGRTEVCDVIFYILRFLHTVVEISPVRL